MRRASLLWNADADWRDDTGENRMTTIKEQTAWQAWQEGYDAACDAKDESANPYPLQSDAHLSWNDGYMAGVSEEDEP